MRLEHAKGILQAVPDEQDTEMILESTANGVGNYFYQQWQQAEAGIKPVSGDLCTLVLARRIHQVWSESEAL